MYIYIILVGDQWTIPVDNIVFVQCFQRQNYLRSIKAGKMLTKWAMVPKMSKQTASV